MGSGERVEREREEEDNMGVDGHTIIAHGTTQEYLNAQHGQYEEEEGGQHATSRTV